MKIVTHKKNGPGKTWKVLSLLFFILNIFLNTTIFSQQEAIEKLLNSDGTLKKGVNGSFSAKGYNLTYGKNGEPVLTKTNSTTNSVVTWNSLLGGPGNGINGTIYAIAICGSDIYFGGTFTSIGDGTPANNIAKWDGSSWSVLPCGNSNGVNSTVRALAVCNNEIYVGGTFDLLSDGTTVNYAAKWNGSQWSALPCGDGSVGLNSFVYTIAVSGTDIYFGGDFTKLGNSTTLANYIAKWNGSWATLPCSSSNGLGGLVNSIAVCGSDIYVAGNFTTFGDGNAVNRIAKWNGTTWSTLPCGSSNGVTAYVSALAVCNNDLYVGGYFTTLGDGTLVNYVAKWNGSQWSTLPSGGSAGVNNVVFAISVDNTDIYVGGSFTTLGDGTTPANRIAKWNGSQWSTLENGSINGVGGSISAIAVNAGSIYIGGGFTSFNDGGLANHIAKWNGSTWSILSGGSLNGTPSSVSAVAIMGSDIYVGGSFLQLGDGTSAYRIAKWNGSTWSNLPCGSGNGVLGDVYVLAVWNNALYVGGSFTKLGDGTTSAKYIAKWDGTQWSNLPCGSSNGVSGNVYTIAPSSTGIYIGGNFSKLGDYTVVNRIAKWDGTQWSTLPCSTSVGVNNIVYSIAIKGTEVYVGGLFSSLGNGTSVKYIAKWDGSQWSPLAFNGAVGVNNVVTSLVVSGSDVYAGGSFSALGDGTTVNGIAKWNGSQWSPLACGSSVGLNGAVYALAAYGTDLYIGGQFTQLSDGTPVNYLTKWNGSSFVQLADGASFGVNSYVNFITSNIEEEKIYIGGNFTSVGDNKAASYVAGFVDTNTPLPVELSSISAKAEEDNVTLSWKTANEVNNYGFDIERKSSSNNWEKIGFVKGSGSSNISHTYSFTDQTPISGKLFYRLKQLDNDGSFKYYDAVSIQFNSTLKFKLLQNTPNPFNPTTAIKYQLPQNSFVTIKIYDNLGREVATLINEERAAGSHIVYWNGKDNFGQTVSSGIYLYKLTAGNFTETRKMNFLK